MTAAFTPVDRFVAEHTGLTAVEQFARDHDAGDVPAQARYYRDLIPLDRPAPGEQYGFEVDLDACTGCKACVTACHSLNGLDADESWRSVGLLHGGGAAAPFQQTVTTACHHCVDPACLKGCPVDAYEKDPATGIVKHLDDQCIGCTYCVFTCPYEVPAFNERRGIVRKCDMCADRLAVGEAPGCVQACPNGAIRIAVVDVATLVETADTRPFLPGAPDPQITVPTTRYRTRRPELHDALPADHSSVVPAHAHPALAVMLVLTQLSVGAFLADLAVRTLARGALVERLSPASPLVALVLGLLAIGAAVLHLGRPQYAFRAVIGLRHSWLSREIVAFGAYAGLAALDAAALWADPTSHRSATVVLGAFVAATGVAGVVCSVMIYAVTGKAWWQPAVVATKFALTSAVCGLAAVLATTLAAAAVMEPDLAAKALDELGRPLGAALAVTMTVKLAFELGGFRHLRARGMTERKRTALLLARDLRTMTTWRVLSGVIGGLIAPAIVVLAGVSAVPNVALGATAAIAGLLAVVTGELLERSQFFLALASPRMPGGLA